MAKPFRRHAAAPHEFPATPPGRLSPPGSHRIKRPPVLAPAGVFTFPVRRRNGAAPASAPAGSRGAGLRRDCRRTSSGPRARRCPTPPPAIPLRRRPAARRCSAGGWRPGTPRRRWPDRKSTRLNSSHITISYAVLCLKKKKKKKTSQKLKKKKKTKKKQKKKKKHK